MGRGCLSWEILLRLSRRPLGRGPAAAPCWGSCAVLGLCLLRLGAPFVFGGYRPSITSRMAPLGAEENL
eukprot:7664231-Pyramimonas_sp.AAC.1